MGGRAGRWLLVVLTVALATGLRAENELRTPPPAVSHPTPRFNDGVPREHWLYDAFQQLWQMGLGSPPPQKVPIIGRRAFTWGEMAAALVDAAQAGRRLSQVGLSDAHLFNLREWDHLTPSKIAAEVEPELRAAQQDTPQFRQDLETLTNLLRGRWPNGVRVPFSLVYGRFDEEAWSAGARQAAQEWKRGEVAFFVNQRPPAWLELNEGLRFRVPTGKYSYGYPREQYIAGHNEALWRMLKEAEPRADLSWLPRVFDLAGTWRREGRNSVRLDRQHPEAADPATDARLLWSTTPVGEEAPRKSSFLYAAGRLPATQPERAPGEHLVFERFPWGETILSVPSFPPASGALDLLWGPPESGVVFFRVRVNDAEKPVRLYAVELQTGSLLNAGAFTEQETGPGQ